MRFFVALSIAVTFGSALGPFVLLAQDSGVNNRRAQLEQDLARLEAEIAAQRSVLEGKQRERVSLERDVAILDAKIEEARLSIRARDIAIQKLSQDIAGKETTIVGLNDKLSRERASLAQLIRKTHELDGSSLAELVLTNASLSSFLADLDDFSSIKVALNSSFAEIADTKVVTQAQKDSLEGKREEEVELRTLQELQKKKIEADETQKNQILKATKGQEAAYQALIKSKEQNAAQIRAELFELRGSAAIPFEKAYDLAVRAGQRTGVRPALILGIIAEESNLGENVGTGSWRVDMHPTRDQPVFRQITQELGLDPDRMPVSKKPWYGWGGAMGPAQFIPSTWVLYEDRVASATGHTPPNPWDPEDAFMAAAILLMDNGADKGTASAERLAALRYLAGWANATKSAYAFYGDDVMELAAKYQGLIDVIAIAR